MFKKIQHIHFVGIGGIGMSGIAELLLNLGYQVSGSDLKPGPITQRLSALGGKIYAAHSAGNVHDANVVVISSAVRQDNVEIVEAKKLQIPVIPRAEMLAETHAIEIWRRHCRIPREDDQSWRRRTRTTTPPGSWT